MSSTPNITRYASPAMIPSGSVPPGSPYVIHINCCGGNGGYSSSPEASLQLQQLNQTLTRLAVTVDQLAQKVETFIAKKRADLEDENELVSPGRFSSPRYARPSPLFEPQQPQKQNPRPESRKQRSEESEELIQLRSRIQQLESQIQAQQEAMRSIETAVEQFATRVSPPVDLSAYTSVLQD